MRRSGAVWLLVLLALAVFPAAAIADSANDQYTEPLPDATGNAGGSDGAGTGGAAGSGGAGPGAEGGLSGGSAGDSAASFADPGATGESSASGAGAAGDTVDGDASGEGVTPLETISSDTVSSSDDGDSFPAVPVILGLLAVIALSSAAAILYNRRREGSAEA